MSHIVRYLSFCVVLFVASQSQAHFIWVDCLPQTGGKEEVRLYFSDSPEPGDLHLIGKIAKTKVWLRDGNGTVHDVSVAAAADGKLAALVSDVAKADRDDVEASCDYGVYARGAKPTLLQYYAKHLPAVWWRSESKFARSERLLLDVVPHLTGQALELTVLFAGQPATERQVIVVDPQGKATEMKTDGQGRVVLDHPAAGRYSVRAAYIQADKAGERDGQKYAETGHYSTVTFDLPAGKLPAGKPPASDAPTATASGHELSAPEALAQARAGRAIWKDFPGFAADVVLAENGKEFKGKVSITAEGDVHLDLPGSPSSWAEDQLTSLVQHRMPDGEIAETEVAYVDNDLTHPLGRKIKLGDKDRQSEYRLRDGVIMEVNRNAGPSRFTISVLEIEWNHEHKYLPRSFVMNFFDSKTGELQSSHAYRNDWQRVGDFDLPKTILEIVTPQKGKVAVHQIDFLNSRLLDKSPAAGR